MSEKQTIYVVTDGDYSEYHICAVFTDKPLAQAYADAWGYRIEEYEANPATESIPVGHNVYGGSLRRDGSIASTVQEMPRTEYALALTKESKPRLILGSWGAGIDRRVVGGFLLATSPEHAIKILNEKRTQLIALNEWPPE